MALTEQQLAEALTAAMKAREMPRVYVLRGVLTAVKNLKVEKRVQTVGEADLVQVLRREIRQREEAEELARKAGRDEIVQQNRDERAILEGFVPALMSPQDLERTIRSIVAETGAGALGPIMAALRERCAGAFDGRLASEIARRLLAQGPSA